MDADERDRLTRLEVESHQMNKDIQEIKTDVRAIREQANKWKGALGVILGAGGLVGFLAGWFKDWFIK